MQQVRINPIVTQNVVTYDAVVAVHDTSGRLLPGMTAQVTISVGKQTHVLAVPIAAVLYRPLSRGTRPQDPRVRSVSEPGWSRAPAALPARRPLPAPPGPRSPSGLWRKGVLPRDAS